MAMQQDSTIPTTAPTIPREVIYNQDDKQWDCYLTIDGLRRCVGWAKTSLAAEALCDQIVYDLLADQALLEVSTPTHDLSDEQADELAEARQLAPTLVPNGAPITVGQLPDGTPVLSGHTYHAHPRPLQVTTPDGYLLVSTRGLAGSWAGVDLHLNTPQLAALRALVADGTLDLLLQLAADWERRPRPRPWPAQTSRAA
jgi:hypothetical protein